jgi:hypothetical protein
MDLRESIEQYRQELEAAAESPEPDARTVALELLQEFLGDYASLQTRDALSAADLEEFFVDWYLRRPGAEATFAVTLLETVRDWLEWSDREALPGLSDRFQPLYERLREDLPRVLEAWEILAQELRQAQADEAEEAGLEDLPALPSAGLVSSGLNRIIRPEEIDYSAAREDYFRIETVEESSLTLQSPTGAELGEGAIGPVPVPERVAELLRAGDILYAEVAPGRQGWEILEIAQVLPGGYRLGSLDCGSDSSRSDN